MGRRGGQTIDGGIETQIVREEGGCGKSAEGDSM